LSAGAQFLVTSGDGGHGLVDDLAQSLGLGRQHGDRGGPDVGLRKEGS